MTFAVEDGQAGASMDGSDEIVRKTEGAAPGRSRKRIVGESTNENTAKEVRVFRACCFAGGGLNSLAASFTVHMLLIDGLWWIEGGVKVGCQLINSINHHLFRPPSPQMRQLVSTTVDVVDETSAAAENRSSVATADGGATGVVHPLFVDIDDDEYTDSLLEIQR